MTTNAPLGLVIAYIGTRKGQCINIFPGALLISSYAPCLFNSCSQNRWQQNDRQVHVRYLPGIITQLLSAMVANRLHSFCMKSRQVYNKCVLWAGGHLSYFITFPLRNGCAIPLHLVVHEGETCLFSLRHASSQNTPLKRSSSSHLTWPTKCIKQHENMVLRHWNNTTTEDLGSFGLDAPCMHDCSERSNNSTQPACAVSTST